MPEVPKKIEAQPPAEIVPPSDMKEFNRRWTDQVVGKELNADPEVRAMLTLAGYIVTNPKHVEEFKEVMEWLQERHKSWTTRRVRRATIIMGALSSVVSLIIGAAAPWIWQLIKSHVL